MKAIIGLISMLLLAGCFDKGPKTIKLETAREYQHLSCIHGYFNGVMDTKHPDDGGVAAINAAAKFCNKEYK